MPLEFGFYDWSLRSGGVKFIASSNEKAVHNHNLRGFRVNDKIISPVHVEFQKVRFDNQKREIYYNSH